MAEADYIPSYGRATECELDEALAALEEIASELEKWAGIADKIGCESSYRPAFAIPWMWRAETNREAADLVRKKLFDLTGEEES